ncbi:ABC transporter permease [Humibacillus xanthopallidus]|uniref:Simple sugar transport system permease protein n=1 Tax=Humibacillus xanthopallidus TaxID=412689 RepID=A0A543I045_9MICO|nr:ABC transporter permease [Humibacillus xanthopallidus]TQM63959.1 simple sugar transport system permease protein [Humibacillus xanthopallidus]
MSTFNARKALLGLAAPLLALLVAFLVTSAILLALGDPVVEVWQTILSWPRPRQFVQIINGATVYYLSAIAVAVGFRMNLFNIGVDGQYRVAAFAGALFAGQAWFPGPLNVLLTLVVAMATGGMWAGIAAYLKVKRGVSEVISTIMLNAIATGVVQWLLLKVAVKQQGSNTISTPPIPESSQLDGLAIVPGASNKVYTLLLLAIVVGVAYWFFIGKTRFGFDLRATGRSETAAVASGVKVPRMVVSTLVISGALAGLIGMPLLFGQDHSYGTTFQAGLGFAGIGIALLGRNHPLGIAVAALLWSFLDVQSNALQIKAGVASEVVFIIQGVILFAVVIAYELIRRADVRLEQQRVARELAGTRSDAPSVEGAAA